MINLKTYGMSDIQEKEMEIYAHGELIPARILAVHKERYEMVTIYGNGWAVLKSSVFFYGGEELSYPTTGDFVLLKHNDKGDSVIHLVLPRKSYFSRNDPSGSGHKEQIIAANFDYIFITSSINNDLNEKRLERYLTLSWQSGAVPVIILTKSDLVLDTESIRKKIQMTAMGAEVYAVSSVTGEGTEALKQYLQPGKTIALLGSSGVGKSSLVNALSGEEIMKVGDIREDDSRGRHTTTHRQLIMLEDGVMFIDTPGMRELGMWDVSKGLGEAFEDVEQYFSLCRFSDCNHNKEPGCAVKQALALGELSQERWKRYLKLKNEAKYVENKEQIKSMKGIQNSGRFGKNSKLENKRKITGDDFYGYN